MSFERGDGRPIRFWGVGSSALKRFPADMGSHARFLAKRGVNMVRIHVSLPARGAGAGINDADPVKIERIQRFVATLKSEGIYTTLSPYWPHAEFLGRKDMAWSLEGYADPERDLWGLLFFNPTLQEAYKSWMRALLMAPSPYGLPLKDEPALAVIQLQNEDSLFFGTLDKVAAPQRARLERLFGRWLIQRYGSAAGALEAWGQRPRAGDSPAKSKMTVAPIFALAKEAQPADDLRLVDETRFLAELQHDFYREMTSYLREELGCRQLINAGNWKTASPERLDDLERWTYTAADVIARNRYAGSEHHGPNRGYRIDAGHVFADRSVLLDPGFLPLSVRQPVGHPFIVTESSWTDPNRYQAEGPLLVNAFGSLVGLDGFYWFDMRSVGWMEDPRRLQWKVGTSYALHKWSVATPQALGQFPANALAFRRGDVATATRPVVYERRSLRSLWQRRPSLLPETASFDPNREAVAQTRASPVRPVDPHAFLVGPVWVGFGEADERIQIVDIDAYVDPERRRVRSVTGQISWDYGEGVMTVDAPRFQAVSGFLSRGGGRYQLSTLGVESDDHYAAIAAVSLDDQPLVEADRILIQLGTSARPTGWSTRPGRVKTKDGREVVGYEIVETGGPPLRVEALNASISLVNASIREAWVLDPNGYAVAPLDVERSGETLRVRLPDDALYVLLD
jgi:hypothetical protein